MRNEELWYRLSAMNFLIGANAVRLFLVCPYIPAISTHYLCFHKPCRGRRPRRPAYRRFVHPTQLRKNPNLATPRNRLSHFCELANRNFAKPLHQSSTVAKSLRSLRILRCAGNNKSGAGLILRYLFV